MKLLNKATFASLLIAGTMVAGSASALDSASAPLTGIVGVSASDLSVRIDDGVATLFGTVENVSDKAAAQRHVAKIDGVEEVINLVLTSS